MNDSCFQPMFQYHYTNTYWLIHCMQNNRLKWLILNENKVHWKRLLTTCTYVCIILLFHFLKIWIKASELMEFWIHCGCKKNKSQCNGYMHTLILYSSISHKMLMYSLARLCSIWWDLHQYFTCDQGETFQ